MRLRTFKLIAAVLTSLPITAFAETFSYSFVDVAAFPVAKVDAGSIDENGDGLQLRGSLPVYDNFFVFTEFQDLSLDRSVDTTRLMIGGGAHFPIDSKMDIVARVGVVNLQVDVGGFDDDDTGIFFGARLRAMIAPRIEVEGGFEHQRVRAGSLDNDTHLVGEARYNFTSQFSAGVLLNVGGDTSVFGVQGRFNF